MRIRLISLKLLVVLCLTTLHFSISFADVISPFGAIRFDSNDNGTAEMTLSTTGLGIGTVPSSRLHVEGNAIISDSLNVASKVSTQNLQIDAALAINVEQVDSDTLLSDNVMVLADSSNNNIILSLPYAGNVKGRSYRIKKISTSNDLYLHGGGNYIDRHPSLMLVGSSDRVYPSVDVVSNGKQWYIASLSQASTSTLASSNLIAYFPFDNQENSSAPDESGQGNDGTLYNYVAAGNGLIDSGYDASGTAYMESSGLAANFPAAQGSLTLWLYYKSWDLSLDHTLFTANFDANNEIKLWSFRGDDQLRMTIKANGSSVGLVTSLSGLNYAGWHHIAMSWDSVDSLQAKIYLDGQLQQYGTIQSFSDTSIESSGNLKLADNKADTFMDELYVYDKVLSQAEIDILYLSK